MLKHIKPVLAVLLAGVMALSCTKDEGPVTPTQKKAAAETGEQNPPADAKLCRADCLGQKPMVIAYYTENSSEVPDANYVTHINFAHGRFVNTKTGEGGIVIGKANTSTDNSSYISLLKKVLALKKTNPELKVLLMVGGWGEAADGFSMMARSEKGRADFCKSVKEKLDTYGMDGIDIDWEYPGGGPSTNAKSDKDAKNFNILLKELRETLGDTKIISYASASNAKYCDFKGALLYLDYVNVMTYDMGEPPYHNSPLHKSSTFNQSGCDDAVEKHRQAGVPLNRQNLGVPFYGHGISPYKDDVKYNEMDAIFKSTTTYKDKNIRKWDDVAKVPYLVDTSGKILLGYDDEESVAFKGRFAVEKGMLGVMVWEYRHDDKQHTLIKSLVKSVYGKETILTNQ